MRLNQDITKQSKSNFAFAAISKPKASCAFDQCFGLQDCVFGSENCVANFDMEVLKQHGEKQPRYVTLSLPKSQSKVKLVFRPCYCLLPFASGL